MRCTVLEALLRVLQSDAGLGGNEGGAGANVKIPLRLEHHLHLLPEHLRVEGLGHEVRHTGAEALERRLVLGHLGGDHDDRHLAVVRLRSALGGEAVFPDNVSRSLCRSTGRGRIPDRSWLNHRPQPIIQG